ncbi:MAG: hypothetical protein ABSG57_12030 [Candidatus Bathyarchaeia archaeon]
MGEKKKEKESEKEAKPKNYAVKASGEIKLSGAASATSISTISGSIQQDYGRLAETFDASQATIANTLHIDQSFEYLKKIADELEKSNKLAEEQRDEAVKDAKRERRNFYLSLAVSIVLGVVAVIVGILALL